MDRGKAGLTVFFEGPFWVGVFERVEDGKLSVCRVVLGSEPKDYEILGFILKNYYGLKFSPAVKAAVKDGRVNPKRRLREAGRQTLQAGLGTRSQQALQLQRKERRTERRQAGKEQKEARKQRMFKLKQQKRKEKHRGR